MTVSTNSYLRDLNNSGNYENIDQLAEIGVTFYIRENYDLAFFFCKVAAEKMHLEGMWHVALLYHSGLGVNQDIEQCIYWLRKAIRILEPDALLELDEEYLQKGSSFAHVEYINKLASHFHRAFE